jgi:hypothetical protein
LPPPNAADKEEDGSSLPEEEAADHSDEAGDLSAFLSGGDGIDQPEALAIAAE